MKENVDEWLNSDIRADLRKMAAWLKKKKIEILVTLVWGGTIATVVIAYYWLVYLEHPEMTQYGVIVISTVPKWTPRILSLGYVVILAASIIVGALLVEFEKVLYSWLTSFFLSFFIAVSWAFLFVWYGLGVGHSELVLSLGGAANQWILQIVLLIVFKMVFPLVPIGCLIAGFIGAIIRVVIQPSATET